MTGGQLDAFMNEMVSEGHQREGLILDLRYNTGGNVHDDVLKFLSRRPYLKWQYRAGQLANQPNFAPAAKPIILLINEQSLSDAEMTAAGFKELGLGTVVGTPTYRWIIFTSGKGLVDGSYYRPTERGVRIRWTARTWKKPALSLISGLIIMPPTGLRAVIRS